MTAIRAAALLVSARDDLAAADIPGQVENGDDGLGVAYGSALIVARAAVAPAAQAGPGARRPGWRAQPVPMRTTG